MFLIMLDTKFRYVFFFTFLSLCFPVSAKSGADKTAIKQAVRDYIESQHKVSSAQMQRALHPDLKKRTYWHNKEGDEITLESSYQGMIDLAGSYNANGDKFPASPKVDIQIFDIDQRAASVKLTADDWIDYMHLVKAESGEWKILNVLWQFNDTARHVSKVK